MNLRKRTSPTSPRRRFQAMVGITFTEAKSKQEHRFEIGEEITHPIPHEEAQELIEAGHITEIK